MTVRYDVCEVAGAVVRCESSRSSGGRERAHLLGQLGDDVLNERGRIRAPRLSQLSSLLDEGEAVRQPPLAARVEDDQDPTSIALPSLPGQ